MALSIAFDAGPTAQGAGVGRYASGLLRALLSQESDDAHTLVLPRGMPVPALEGEVGRWRAMHLPVGERAADIAWHRLRLPLPIDLLCGRPDVFHAPNFLLPPLLRAKGVVTVHDLSYLRLPQYAYPSLARYLASAVPRSLRRTDIVLADSRNTADDVTELLHVPADRVRPVYPGVDDQFTPSAAPGEREDLERVCGIAGRYVLCVGTIEPRKNLVAAIQAFEHASEELGADLELVLAGAVGWMADETLTAARAAGPRVRLIGRLPDSRLPALYRGAEALLYPSHYEGFGLPPLEAMACGTPVIVSRNSSLPEVVGEAGVYCGTDSESIAAALVALLADSGRRARLGRAGLERARLFTWEAAAEQVRGIYYELA